MYLKSLTLKGFKSFADPTTLDFEPGVTVVVGPNGSGKSNVVDAVAWVLGAQGPRVVRSAKMDDVIFAGTAKRAALGRAEVSLTIDNSQRRLPIDFNEVTITRTLFRSGESEYQLNGTPCRLLDIQELLSDTGVGRQQHVIVGQGQLDAILTARPEERRMVIEEAAGVLKYRRRRERSERRLEASEQTLSRLQDLLREVRRQVKPLERQASSALRHQAIADEADALRRFLGGQELRELEDCRAVLSGVILSGQQELAESMHALQGLDSSLTALQGEFDANRGADLAPMVSRFVQLKERTSGLGALVAERRRARSELVAMIDDADALVAMEEELREVSADLDATERVAVTLAPKWDELAAAEQGHGEAESSHVERFGLTDTTQANVELGAARTAEASARDALGDLKTRAATSAERLAAFSRRRDDAQGEVEQLARELDNLARDESELAADLVGRERDAGLARSELVAAEQNLRDNQESAYAAARSRAIHLEEALGELRARAGLERLSSHEGVLGTLFDLVHVDAGFELAFEAALEGLMDSVLIEGSARARAALEHLRSQGGGAVISLEALRNAAGGSPAATLPLGATWLRHRVHGTNASVEAVLDALFGDTVVVEHGFSAALDEAIAHPRRTIVTTEGDRFSARSWRIASSTGATRAALDAARANAQAAEAATKTAQARADAARAKNDEQARDLVVRTQRRDAIREATVRVGLAHRQAQDQRAAAASELDLATNEANQIQELIREAKESLAQSAGHLGELDQLEQVRASRGAEALAARRALEERARSLGALRRDLEVRAASLEERRSLLVARRDTLADQIAHRAAERDRMAKRRSAHESEDLAFGRLKGSLDRLSARLDTEVHDISTEQQRRSVAAQERLERLSNVRGERDVIERSVATLRDNQQRLEIDETEVRVRHEACIDRLRRELEIEPEEALAVQAPELGEGIDPSARLHELERELRLLGPVNPLAREELAALQERHDFLETQLEDVRNARRELSQVIHAIDAEIVDVFANAYADVERHFSDLVAMLFPGGSGRLELTAPDDLLNTGVEIEARPAGRNVRRLSLLSGGERSLVAVAFLFAVFRSRPSPFYILDEVEAALDEVNLLRFLDLVEEFRNEAQLVIVSHQKKTMETANALYGITMQPGGASKAVSEMLARLPSETSREVAYALDLGRGPQTASPSPQEPSGLSFKDEE